MVKQFSAAFLACLGLTATARAQAPMCGPPSWADRVALNALPDSNLMTVPVTINGTQKQFLLDIGANADEISQPAAAQLQLPQIDRNKPYNAISDQNTLLQIQAPVVDVQTSRAARTYQSRVGVTDFTLGAASLHNLQFLVSADADMGRSKPYDGRFTAAGFRRYDLNIDFGSKELGFLAATGCSDANQIVFWPHTAVAVIPMGAANGKIGVPVTVGGHQIDAVIDTGSDHTVMRRAIAERVLGLKTDGDMTPDGDLRDGAGERVYRHTFPEIAFEGVVAINVPARIQANSMVRRAQRAPVTGSRLQFTDDPGEIIPDLALGMDVLRQLHIYAAFQQRKLYVTAAH